MRWIPALFILFLAFVSGLDIVINFKKLTQPRFVMLAWLYLVCLLAILFMPISSDGVTVQIMPPGIGRVNLRQLQVNDLQFYENILMTVPLGVLIKKYLPKIPLTLVAILGIFFGTSFETIQYILSHVFFINRTSDINDVLSNAFGVVVGAVLMLIYRQIKKGE